MEKEKEIILQDLIYEIRGQKVMLDSDLARLYNVEVKRLNESIKRNIERFPQDFMFKITQKEWDILRSQFATANRNISKVRYLPYAFSEHGVLMLSNVLSSKKAIKMSIQIIRVFEKLRKYVHSQNDTGNLVANTNEQIAEIKKFLMLHIENSDQKLSEHDKAIRQIISALNNLIEKPKEIKKIGF